VLGKHSGRHAVETRLRGLGVQLDAARLEAVTAEVKELADRQKFVYDDDLLALVDHGVGSRPHLVRYQVLTGNQVLPTATVEVEVDDHRRSASAVGKGPLDAALKAADAALGLDLELLDLHTRAVTSGKDAIAEVTVRVRHADQETVGQAASPDSIEAALKAYLSAVGAARRARAAAA
jgi:2-isopropylmalate synthase